MNKNVSFTYHLRPKNLLRKAATMLPKEWQTRILRNQLRLPVETLDGLTVKIAHRKHELEGAFTVLHDSYVKAGYMSPHPSGLRVTSYHALPSTTTVVAMIGDEVLGTFSIIRDGLFGFPSDSIVDTNHLRVYGLRIAEISALAINPKHRKNSGQILWPMLSYLVRYCIHYFGIDALVIAVHPTHYPFYKHILCFETLTEKVIKKYDFVNDMPAMCGTLNMRDMYRNYAIEYGKNPSQSNLFDFFFEKNFTCMRFPKRENFKISDPFLTPDLLNHFFRERTDAFLQMSPGQIAILHELYKMKSYRDVLPSIDSKIALAVHSRKDLRFDYRCKGQIFFSDKRRLEIDVLNVSANGFQAKLEEGIRFGHPFTVRIGISEFIACDVECYPVWVSQNNTFGFNIIGLSPVWTKLIHDLEKDFQQQHSRPPFSGSKQVI